MKIIDFASTDFVHLKNTDCLIIDKTRYIYRLLKSGNRFVINTAPYGFGKSLIASMIEALFKAAAHALRLAVAPNNGGVLSTKGML